MKEFDLLEMILQAHEYEELEGKPGRLQEFFDSTQGRYYISFNLVVRADDRLYGLSKGGVIFVFLISIHLRPIPPPRGNPVCEESK